MLTMLLTVASVALYSMSIMNKRIQYFFNFMFV